MTTNPAAHTALSNTGSRVLGATGLWLANSAHQNSLPSKKSRRKSSGSHNKFWQSISKVAAQHNCHQVFQRPLPSSMRCTASEDEPSTSGRENENLLIVGPGVLGGLVGKLYKEDHPESEVIGQTNTDTNHEKLKELGIRPRLKQNAGKSKFPNVLFSAPPSGSPDYVAEVEGALQLWDRSSTFIFTSSSGALDTSNVSIITEDTPLQKLGASERVDRLLKAEEAVIEAGGCVLRLVGLYHLNRGAHTFFLRQGEVQRAGNRVVNLIHYEDAASLILKIIEGLDEQGKKFKGKYFFGTDGEAISFQEMMDATLQSGKFSGEVKFTAPDEQKLGPGSSNQETRKLLGWTPKYTSFKDFMLTHAQDYYSQSGSQ